MFYLSLLNSSVLAFSLLAILPIIIHLFSKKKPIKVIFSSIRFIVESQSAKKRKFSLLNLILLIIRVLIIILFFFALSRPSIKGLKSKNHTKTAFAIIVDNSYSMDYFYNGSTDLEKAKMMVVELNKLFKKGDLISLYTRSPKWNNFNSGFHSGFLPDKIIGTIGISPNFCSLDSLLIKVNRELLNTGYSNRKIFYFTDGQKEKIKFKESEVNIIPVYPKNEKNNLSCEKARFENVWQDNSLKSNISCIINNYSHQKKNDVVCELIVDGVKHSEKVISLSSQQSKKIYFPLLIEQEGFHSGYVIVNDEHLDFDNKSYFSFKYDLHHKAAIISDEKKLPISLESVLISIDFTKKIFNSDVIDKEVLNNYDLIVVYRKKEISPAIKLAIENFPNKILIITDKNISESFKSYMKDENKMNFLNYISEKYPINYYNKYSPITSIMNKNMFASDFWKVKTDRTTLISTSKSGILFEVGKGRFVLNTDIGIENNEFWQNRIFPLLFYRIVFNDEISDSYNFVISDKIKIVAKNIVLPDKKKIELKNSYFIPEEIGNYSYEDKDGRNSKFSVNLDYKESNYQKMEKYPANFKILNSKISKINLVNKDGLEIWKWIFILVLLLLILETLIVVTAQKESKE